MYYEGVPPVDHPSPDRPTRGVPPLNDENMANMLDGRKKDQTKDGKEDTNTKEEEERILIDSIVSSSWMQQHMIVLWSDEHPPAKKIHPFMPLISYTRNILISLSVFGLMDVLYAQLFIVTGVEFVYMSIVILYSNKKEKVDNYVDIFNCCTNATYMILKVTTVFDIEDNTRQVWFGRMMVIVLVTNFIGNMIYVVYSICMMVRKTVLEWKRKYKLTKEQKMMDRMKGKWIDTFIYEYSLQPQEMADRRVSTPVEVDEPRRVLGDVPLILPMPTIVNIPLGRINRPMSLRKQSKY